VDANESTQKLGESAITQEDVKPTSKSKPKREPKKQQPKKEKKGDDE